MVSATTTGLRDNSVAASTLQQIQWAAATGTADAITVAYPIPNTSLSDGLILGFRAAFRNATTAPTFSPDGLTVHTITRSGGRALAKGDIPGSQAEMLVRYNFTNTRWELLNPQGKSIQSANGAGTGDAITATFPVPITALEDGLIVSVRAPNGNGTIAPTFAPDGLSAKTITKTGNDALIPGDYSSVDTELLLRYNSVNDVWELLNPIVDDKFYVLATDDTGGQNSNTAQPIFPTSGSVTVRANTHYEFEMDVHISRAAGAVSHTTSILFGGTATLTYLAATVSALTGDALTGLASATMTRMTSAAATQIKAASTSTTEQILFRVHGTFVVNAGGTFTPQFIYSTAPGGTPTIKQGTNFKARPLGNGGTQAKGSWQ